MTTRVLLLLAGVLCGACGGNSEIVAQGAEASESPASTSAAGGAAQDGTFQPDGTAPRLKAMEIFGSRFAGVWREHVTDSSAVTHLGIVHLTDPDRQKWASETDFGDEVILHDRQYFASDLERYKKVATDYLDANDAYCMVGLDPSHGVLEVRARSDKASQAIQDGLRKRIPADAMHYTAIDCHPGE